MSEFETKGERKRGRIYRMKGRERKGRKTWKTEVKKDITETESE